LDIAFNQDHNRVHKDHAPENLAVLQHIALNLVKQENRLVPALKSNACALVGTTIICARLYEPDFHAIALDNGRQWYAYPE
jgi:hypothetical protein